MPRFVTVLALAVCVSACASQDERYHRNLKQVQIDKSVRLPQSEIEQIIRTVSRESMFPVLVTTRWKSHRGDEVVVYTDLSHDPQRFMAYHLKKEADGAWRIFWHGEGSIILVDRTQ
jgi:hypothetical protein